MSWRRYRYVLATEPCGLPSMSWQQHQVASPATACLGVNTGMSRQQHQAASPACAGINTRCLGINTSVLTAAPGACPGTNASMSSWRQHHQEGTDQAPSPACLGTTTSMSWLQPACLRTNQHVLASTPACLATNISTSWHQHQLACLGNSTRRRLQLVLAKKQTVVASTHEHEHVLESTSMSWRQHQNVLATAPGSLISVSWHEHHHVLASTPECLCNSTRQRPCLATTQACLGNSTRRPPQHVLARTPACLVVNTSMSRQQH